MSKIEWTQRTWNPLLGCSKISEGCRNCYAMRMAYRMAHMPSTRDRYEGIAEKTKGGDINWTGDIRLNTDALYMPVERAKPTIWFVNSMSDLFHEDVPFDWIDLVFDKMEASPQHIFQILTKRPRVMYDYFGWKILGHGFKFEKWPLPNVWPGVSIENQQAADERIKWLNLIDASVKFISAEPLLGQVNLSAALQDTLKYHAGGLKNCISWVIVGGESGPKARPMHPAWARSLRDQCVEAKVPFFFKQWGEWIPCEEIDLSEWKPSGGGCTKLPAHVKSAAGDIRSFHPTSFMHLDANDTTFFGRVGKHAAGRKLDGREWNEMPKGEIPK